MTRAIPSIALASLLLAIALTLSCSGDGGGGGNGNTTEPIKKAKITGVFQKGPFVQGTLATLNELNYDLSPTGRPFQTLITDNKGSFELKDVELVSPYAHLIATGYYRNEVTGDVSGGTITLQAIADITKKDNVNVNILTHLEYYRVLDLVEAGKSIKEAKKQAQKEILAVFGIDSDYLKDSEDMTIFGTSESDAALLAVSILLLGDLSDGQFSQRLMDFAQSLRTSGKWENDEEKRAMAEWASGASLEGISINILAWKLSQEVPEFGKYVNDYWHASYGLGECDAEGWGNVDGNFVCKNGVWQVAKYMDIFCSGKQVCSILTDVRDGKEYIAVQIGEQIWMAENLNYEAEGSKCYDNNPANCDIYGILYDWNTAMKACPDGWHLPTEAEWLELFDFAGGDMAGKNLKASSGWNENGNGIDEYGFNALPGGYRFSNGNFYAVGEKGGWWSASGFSSYFAHTGNMHYSSENASLYGNNRDELYSVRCLQN